MEHNRSFNEKRRVGAMHSESRDREGVAAAPARADRPEQELSDLAELGLFKFALRRGALLPGQAEDPRFETSHRRPALPAREPVRPHSSRSTRHKLHSLPKDQYYCPLAALAYRAAQSAAGVRCGGRRAAQEARAHQVSQPGAGDLRG